MTEKERAIQIKRKADKAKANGATDIKLTARSIIENLGLSQNISNYMYGIIDSRPSTQEYIEKTIKILIKYTEILLQDDNMGDFQKKEMISETIKYCMKYSICPTPEFLEKRIELLVNSGVDEKEIMKYPELLKESVSDKFLSLLYGFLTSLHIEPNMENIACALKLGISTNYDDFLIKLGICIKSHMPIEELKNNPYLLREEVDIKSFYYALKELKKKQLELFGDTLQYELISIRERLSDDIIGPVLESDIKVNGAIGIRERTFIQSLACRELGISYSK